MNLALPDSILQPINCCLEGSSFQTQKLPRLSLGIKPDPLVRLAGLHLSDCILRFQRGACGLGHLQSLSLPLKISVAVYFSTEECQAPLVSGLYVSCAICLQYFLHLPAPCPFPKSHFLPAQQKHPALKKPSLTSRDQGRVPCDVFLWHSRGSSVAIFLAVPFSWSVVSHSEFVNPV